jgi:signal transduction histidine kinase
MYFTVETAPYLRLPLYKTVLGVTCALLLIVNGFSLFHNLQALRGAQVLLSQTARVADRLQYLNVLVLDAESSMRSYFLSGRDAYLGPTRTALADSETEFKELQKLLADNPTQLKNLAQLQTLVRRRLSIMTQAIDVYRDGGLQEIVNIAKLSDDRSSMDEIRLLVVIMEQEQNETLNARSALFYEQYHKAVLLGMGINAVAIVVLIMFYQLVRRSFAHRAAVEHALQSANENLESTVQQRTEQLSVLSRHLISISEEEKVRLSRELHDELGANLTSISMDIAAVTQQLRNTHPELAEQLKRARGTLVETVEMKRRIVENLRPSLLDNLGLCAAIESYCEEFSRLSQVRCDCSVAADMEAMTRHSGDLSIALFRIVQESLTNIRKYAKASRVTVTLNRSGDGLMLRIIDDGIGIASDTIVKPMSHGLLGMRERALLLGGSLNIRRGRNDTGTCIEVAIPLRGVEPMAAPEHRRVALPSALTEVISSALHQPADDQTPSSLPYSTRPHTPPSLSDQAQ